MSFEVKILGSNSATPVYNRHQSSQLLLIEQHYFLIDCGEATQYQLLKYKIRINRIDHIFISHLHGDHYLGLVGLISSMHLQGRKKELHVYGPPGLDEIITIQLRVSQTILHFPLHYTELKTLLVSIILDTPTLTVETIPLKHRIQCCGFLFREKPKKRRLKKELLGKEVSLADMAKLKNGEDVKDDAGKILYTNEQFTLPPRRSRSYAYCSDTIYDETLVPQLMHVDMLYHESTFLTEHKERAAITFHSTASQAGTIAKLCSAGKLIIGHFSSRYKDLNPLLQEARVVFESTSLAIEGSVHIIEEE